MSEVTTMGDLNFGDPTMEECYAALAEEYQVTEGVGFDPTIIISVITMIISLIQDCGNINSGEDLKKMIDKPTIFQLVRFQLKCFRCGLPTVKTQRNVFKAAKGKEVGFFERLVSMAKSA